MPKGGWARGGVSLLAAPVLLSACSMQPAMLPVEGHAHEASAAWVADRPAVAWYGGGQSREAIFLRQADASDRWGPALALTDGSRDAYEPSLQDFHGDALVAWYEQSPANGPAPGRRQALLARFDSAGRPRWRRELSPPDADGRIPVVRVAGDAIEVAWLEQRDGATPSVRVATLDGEGRWLRPARDVAAGSDTWNLNAAISPDGALHVVFDAALPGGAKELHWVKVANGQATLGRVSRDDGHDSVYPDLAFDADRFAVTWFDARAGNDEVYLRCGRQDAIAGGIPHGALDDGDARRVTRTRAASQGAYLAWHEGHVELAWVEVTANRRMLWRQRFDADCRPAGRARPLGLRRDVAGIPSLSASKRGLLIAWSTERGQQSAPAARPGSAGLFVVVAPDGVSPSAAAR